jgi:hypothetical protein
MTDETRQRRDRVRELGEAVISALQDAVCEMIRDQPDLLSADMIQDALAPHMKDAAKRIAASEEFQAAVTDRLTHDMFESLKPPIRAMPEHVERVIDARTMDQFDPDLEGPPSLGGCSICERVGDDRINCQRASCPFNVQPSV